MRFGPSKVRYQGYQASKTLIYRKAKLTRSWSRGSLIKIEPNNIIINIKKNKSKPTMIFPHTPFSSSINYYPYLFSTNFHPNFYNYFPANFPAFPPLPTNNVVYTQEKLIKSQHVELPIAVTCQNSSNTSNACFEQKSLNKPSGVESHIMQLCNRNVLPNNVSLILCFIRRIKKSGKLVQKIIAKLNPKKEYTIKRFYSYQLFLKQNCTDFKWKQGIEVLINFSDPDCSSFPLEQQQFYNRVCRILISQYLQQICRLEVLNHTKINKSHIQDHLRVIRYIGESLKGENRIRMTIQYQ